MTDSDELVDDAGFIGAVSDTMAVLSGLADAHSAMNAKHGYLPSADSRAMTELAREPEFQVGGWVEPIHEAHVLASLLAYSGVDHLRSYAHLFSSPPIPVYAHLTMARGALEAFAWSRWLGDSQIDAATRAKRGRLFQLDDGLQRKRLPIEEMKAEGARIIARVRDGAPAGWVVVCNDSRVLVGGEPLGKPADLISAVLALGPSEGVDRLGATLWGYLSGVSHGRRYALTSAMERAMSGELGPTLGAMATTARTVHLIGVVLARACTNASEELFRLFGWSDEPEWRAAVATSDQHTQAVMRAVGP